MTPIRSLCAGVLVSLLCACSVEPVLPPATEAMWRDAAFDYDPNLVVATRQSLFQLDATTLSQLRADGVTEQNLGSRVAYLMTLVFGPQMKAFEYVGGHSTVAAQTWRNKRGDCLSLTVMSYALARALDVPLQMQEVRVPVNFDRRDGVDFLNQHVNSIVHTDRPLRVGDRMLPAGELLVDFLPQIGSNQRGKALDENAVLARYYNNVAAEQLALGRDRMAYAHFRAAIRADPAYAASYANLAALYLRAGLNDAAETALRQALLRNPHADLALSSLHQLLLSQGRTAEAATYEKRLRAGRDNDPYYWLGLGIERIRKEQFAAAADALEHAQQLTSGFTEVHQYLAIAYWRSGRQLLARDQLAILRGLDTASPKMAALSRKFSREPPLPQTH